MTVMHAAKENWGASGTVEKLCYLVVAIGSLLACAYGLRISGLLSLTLWSNPQGSIFLGVCIASALVIAQVIALRASFPLSMVVAATVIFLGGVFAGVGATFVNVLALCSAYGLGRRIMQGSTIERMGPMLAAVVQTALGLGVIATLVFAWSFTPFNHPALYLALLSAPLVVGWRRNMEGLRDVFAVWRHSATEFAPVWVHAAHLLIAFSVLLRLLAVLHPEIGADALATHLVIADQLKNAGTFHYNVTQSIWAVMPMAADWVMAAIYMVSDEAGARLANFAADLLVVAMVMLGAARLRGRNAAAIAGLIYSTLPLLYRESSTIYVENFWTMWLCAALALGVQTLQAHKPRDVIAASILLGVAFSAKVITVFFFFAFFVPIAVCWVVTDRKIAVRNLLLSGSVIAGLAVWPYLNAWIKTGNPVFPFMNHLFGSPYFDSGENFSNSLYISGVNWHLLYDLTFQTDHFLEGRPGALGLSLFLFFFISAAALFRENWLVRWGFVGSILFVLGVFEFQSYLRYIMPALPVLAVVMGLCLVRMIDESRAQRAVMVPMLLASAVASLYLTPSSTWQYSELAVPPLHGSEQWKEYRYRATPGTYAVDLLNSMGARRVLWIGKPHIAGATADVYVTNWHGGNTARQVESIGTRALLNRWIARNKIDAIVVGAEPRQALTEVLQQFIRDGTDEAGSRDTVTVYKVRQEFLYNHELLSNPDFKQHAKGWKGNVDTDAESGAVLVSAKQNLSQVVIVEPGTEYLLEVEARCSADNAPYRMQVNWLTSTGEFLRADIRVQQCEHDFKTRSVLLTAPEDAGLAAVYASGHNPLLTVAVDRVSFRQ